MWVGIVSIFPDMVRATLSHGVVGRAIDRGDIDLAVIDPRDFSDNVHRNVDDRPFGGGPGMVMMGEPLSRSVEAGRTAAPSAATTIYLTPQGRTFTQTLARDLAEREAMILVAGRYEGVDERFIERDIDLQLSIGDYVISGGELAALVVLDAVARLRPGTLGNAESINFESHMDGLLDFPHYTRPQELEGESVPEVLLSGDHQRVARWRRQQALGRTWQRRPDMLAGRVLSPEDRDLLAEFMERNAEKAP